MMISDDMCTWDCRGIEAEHLQETQLRHAWTQVRHLVRCAYRDPIVLAAVDSNEVKNCVDLWVISFFHNFFSTYSRKGQVKSRNDYDKQFSHSFSFTIDIDIYFSETKSASFISLLDLRITFSCFLRRWVTGASGKLWSLFFTTSLKRLIPPAKIENWHSIVLVTTRGFTY